MARPRPHIMHSLLQLIKLYADIADETDTFCRLPDILRWIVRFTLVGLRSLYPHYHPNHHRRGDLVPASLPGASGPGVTSGALALFPFLVVADNRYVDPRMGVDTSQAPCPLRNRR